MLGRYTFVLTDQVARGKLWTLTDPKNSESEILFHCCANPH